MESRNSSNKYPLSIASISMSPLQINRVQGNTKFLVKSDTEYTSPIESIMRIKEEGAYLVVTENSLYIVSMDIPVKKIVSGEKKA